MIKLVDSLKRLNNQEIRRKMQRAAEKYISIDGSKEIVDAILNK
jgi:hypothetical protein